MPPETTTLEAPPAVAQQPQISPPLSDSGKSILSAIFDKPVRPDELSQSADVEEVKKALGDRFQGGEKKEEDFDITKEPEQSEEDKLTDPFKKKESKPDAKPEDKKPEDKKEPDDKAEEEEATGKIKNINDARKLYKEHKKLKAKLPELEAKLTAKDKEITDAKAELDALKKSGAPTEEIAAQKQELEELRAQKELVKARYDELEQRDMAHNIEKTEPWDRQVNKPLERLGKDLEELASSISEDEAERNEFMGAVGRALNIADPKARRKAVDELTAPLTQGQAAEVVSLAKDFRKVVEQRELLKANSAEALKIIKAKEDTDRKQFGEKSKAEFISGAKEARADLAKMYPLLARTDLPEEVLKEIKEIEDTMEKVDPSKLPPKEVAKFIEGYYKIKLVSDAAKKHIDFQAKNNKEQEAKVAELTKINEAFLKELTQLKAKHERVDNARPNLGDGSSGGPGEPTIIDSTGVARNILR